ncbi:MAG: type VI secretion system tip protein TssI/VgrG [Pseudomonadota bacterium]|nr:type VI secretion system tip protein TssI/VgrG [Pseudomonadota bacterium]
MNAPLYTQDNLRITVTSPFGPDKLLFKSLQGEEYLSKLFQFNIEMLAQVDDLEFNSIIGQNLGITIQFPEDNQRYINGMVTRFVQAGTDARFSVYHAEIRPWLWALTLTQNCRIFQQLSVPDLLKKIFNELGFSDYRFKLMYPHEPREYCVQYEETAFNFAARLMEDEGMFYFFEHQADKHTLIIADDLGAHPLCPGIDTARFWQSPNETSPEDVITQCQFGQQMVSGKYAVDDFNFEIPSTRLRTQVGGPCGDYRIYEYAAGYCKRDQGDIKVRRRIEAHELNQKLLEGQGHCFSFTAGHQFNLTEHTRGDLNRAYVLRWVSHSLSLNHYSNAFHAFPADIPFRPPLITPKPKIVSTQTAIVTGPSGEEIWTDNYGRIKVQFHWDQEGQYDENSSCWIRVNQSWAGKGWGHISLPRIGQEVIVSFLNGNPDTPVVTGGVYNAQQVVPYGLPGAQTKSTLKSNSSKGGGGSNELRFEDKAGQEEIFVHAQKDQNEIVENNMSTTVKADKTVSVVGNITVINTGSEAKGIYIEAKGEGIVLKCGDSSMTLHRNGTIEIKGNIINITGTATVCTDGQATNTVKGGVVLLNP